MASLCARSGASRATFTTTAGTARPGRHGHSAPTNPSLTTSAPPAADETDDGDISRTQPSPPHALRHPAGPHATSVHPPECRGGVACVRPPDGGLNRGEGTN
eukprot:TRINITY_DN10934_c0_g3_i1.p2 TRINITY_DN10934_c0_g3~~TRINITY_DN10934_c0_g3_i1.p2  ORF type:complete len:102 (-),score=5.83 TRINITY_DN10934_c0_g3_i1:20-325(-)